MQQIVLDTPSGPIAARLWDRAGARAPWLHFGHATGMHGGLYATRLDGLADRFRILACDARGHGRTAALGNCRPVVDWGEMADDLIAAITSVDVGAQWTLAGHSLGAVVAALAAVRAPARVNWLVMAEPAIMAFALARSGGPEINVMAARAAARRPAFADADAARIAWTGRGVFADWAPADLDAHVADALLPGAPARLACTPDYEAMTFAAWPRSLEASLAALQTPFALLGATCESTVAPAEFESLRAHPACRLATRIPGAGHFLPLSHWPQVAAAIARGPAPISMASAPS